MRLRSFLNQAGMNMNINQVTGNLLPTPAPAANVEARPVSQANPSSSSLASVNESKRSTENNSRISNKELSEAEVRKTVEQLNQQLSQVMNANNDVNFKVDKGSGRMVIQVVDRETNTVIRQIPSKEIIEISKALEGKTGVLLKDQA
ncbi:MAG: flagellar protein FlaG [Burkholderiaceae bacterium]|nr:MAG: flagellar protein FlaG [Burkholderiaceae bacterium]